MKEWVSAILIHTWLFKPGGEWLINNFMRELGRHAQNPPIALISESGKTNYYVS